MSMPTSKKFHERMVHFLYEMNSHMILVSGGKERLTRESLNMANNVTSMDEDQYHSTLDWALDRMEEAGCLKGVGK